MRVEIEVSGAQEEKLRSFARERGVSFEDAVRLCLEETLRAQTPSAEDRKAFYERASRWIGAFEDIEGATDLSLNHNRYLFER